MRALVLALLCASCAGAAVAKRPTPLPPWPVAGRAFCGDATHCVHVSPADAAAIRQAILDALDEETLRARPEWRGAKAKAELPIVDFAIGGYLLSYSLWERQPALELCAVESLDLGMEKGFRIVVQRDDAAWRVREIRAYHEPLPEPYGG